MYKKQLANKTSISINNSVEGETIETKIERITTNKEPIKDGAPLIYTDREEGVNPAHDIRTDRWEVALDAMDKVSKAKTAQREARQNIKKGLNADGSDPNAAKVGDNSAEPKP